MGVRLRSAVSPVTPAIIGSRRPRHRIGLKAPPVRFQPAATSTPAPVACGWHRGAIFMDAHNSLTVASHVLSWASRHPRRYSRGSRIGRPRRATMARPTASISSARKWKSYSAETSAGACRPRDLCHSYNRRRRREPADFTAERLAAARGTEAPWIAVARPRAYLRTGRGPRPLRRRSTWLLLSPKRVIHLSQGGLWLRRFRARDGGRPERWRRARAGAGPPIAGRLGSG